MDKKQENQAGKKESSSEKGSAKKKVPFSCRIDIPGPKYKLKGLVGYIDHCPSRYRNPAYTFGRRQIGFDVCEGPGPIYMVHSRKPNGFTFGHRPKDSDTRCSPGPYSLPPPPKGPAFSIRSRTPYRSGAAVPGPYYVKIPRSGIAFTIGRRQTGTPCEDSAGPYDYDINVIKPRAPMFSIGFRQSQISSCEGPGPKYNPKLPKPTPMYSFGVKHSECAPPYIVECDASC